MKTPTELNLRIKALAAICVIVLLLAGVMTVILPAGKSQAAMAKKRIAKRHTSGSSRRHTGSSSRRHNHKSSSRHKHHKVRKSRNRSSLQINVPVTEISRGPENVNKVALTFDAGAGNQATEQILKALKDANIKATFFLTGKWVEQNPELAKRIAAEGHVIGNHTYSHPHLTQETDDSVANQIETTENIIMRTTGINTKPLFRFPYGDRDPRVLSIVANEGYKSIYWTVDSLDWSPSMAPQDVKERILSGLCNGAIILEHCGSPQTAEILPDLINEIKSRGYEIVTVPQLIN